MSEVPESGLAGNDLADDLYWLEGRSWADLTAQERQLIVDSQTTEIVSEGAYIPSSSVSSLIGLLHESGVLDAANVDAEFIREELGIEHIRSPEKIEHSVQRLIDKRCVEAYEYERKEPLPIMLEDIVKELALMEKEAEYERHVEDDINFLKLIGVDPRQLDDMSRGGDETRAEIHSLACDLRSGTAKDIAEHYMIRNQKGRPVMRSYEDIVISVMARKHREGRQGQQLLEGQESALQRAARVLRELESSEEGRHKLITVLSNAFETEEGRELLLSIWKAEQNAQLEASEYFFRPGELDWEE